ncbi:MAG: hypothetical protein IJ889_00630 [Eubacterium sp.]|nr:hypothetical protein [Eubacterium sp.]MBR2247433.1 hypothetical protein [Bacilli bacterium]
MFINVETASVNGYVSERPFVISTDAIAYAYPCCTRNNDGNIAFEDAMAAKDIEVVLTSGTTIRISLKKKTFKEFVDLLHEKTNKSRVEVSNPKSKSGAEKSFHITQ